MLADNACLHVISSGLITFCIILYYIIYLCQPFCNPQLLLSTCLSVLWQNTEPQIAPDGQASSRHGSSRPSV